MAAMINCLGGSRRRSWGRSWESLWEPKGEEEEKKVSSAESGEREVVGIFAAEDRVARREFTS